MAEDKKYMIRVYSRLVEVSRDVYCEYYRMDRYARYQEERDLRHGKTLYCNLDTSEALGEEMIPDMNSLGTEDAAIAHILHEQLHQCLNMLSEEERELIKAIYFDGLTEREYAKRIGISQNAVNKRRHRILAHMKKLITN